MWFDFPLHLRLRSQDWQAPFAPRSFLCPCCFGYQPFKDLCLCGIQSESCSVAGLERNEGTGHTLLKSVFQGQDIKTWKSHSNRKQMKLPTSTSKFCIVASGNILGSSDVSSCWMRRSSTGLPLAPDKFLELVIEVKGIGVRTSYSIGRHPKDSGGYTWNACSVGTWVMFRGHQNLPISQP